MLRMIVLASLVSLGGCSFAFGGPRASSPRESIGTAIVDGALATASFAAAANMSCQPNEFACTSKVLVPATAVIGAVFAVSAIYGLGERPSAPPPPPVRPWNPDEDAHAQVASSPAGALP